MQSTSDNDNDHAKDKDRCIYNSNEKEKEKDENLEILDLKYSTNENDLNQQIIENVENQIKEKTISSISSRLSKLSSKLFNLEGSARNKSKSKEKEAKINFLREEKQALEKELADLTDPTRGNLKQSGDESRKEMLIRTGRLNYFDNDNPNPDSNDTNYNDNVEIINDTTADLNRILFTGQIEQDSEKYMDDGDELFYRKRASHWANSRKLSRSGSAPDAAIERTYDEKETTFDDFIKSEARTELVPPFILSANLGLKVPGEIAKHLFNYQKTCLRWLAELYTQRVGGILGDEMGLGKTVQMVSFIAALHHSGLLVKPVLVVCPATVLRMWVREFRKWWPPLRVAILHASGSGGGGGSGNHKRRRGQSYDESQSESQGESQSESQSESQGESQSGYEDEDKNEVKSIKRIKKRPTLNSRMVPNPIPTGQRDSSNDSPASLISRIVSSGHVLITTYSGIRNQSKLLGTVDWGYCILDEGHKIRNPDSAITILCKRLKTRHRIILSGTPIQNNLNELWSLFDFVYPGRLGTLPIFKTQFAVPINLGGYANASNIQVQTAYKCAAVLKDFIAPYLLRRLKQDVASQLPAKNEKVLFCKLTSKQKEIYTRYIESDTVLKIRAGTFMVFKGIDTLRKICNHPDLTVGMDDRDRVRDWGDVARSGKLRVVESLLEMWKRDKHKVLLFCQTRQMLDIIEIMVKRHKYAYSRMDGTTRVVDRALLVDEFNGNPERFIFLLTTKVGGLGVNLTGADRVVIFDPDWNPSTDMQARERAWRLGQEKKVTVYRLMTSGTIEEKIYHRQIFKQFLTNKVLKDPRQQRFFKSHDLNDLFSYDDRDQGETETGDLFEKSKVDLVENVVKTEEWVEPVAESNWQDSEKSEDPVDQKDTKARGQIANDKDLNTPNDDSNILKHLFSTTGVHSALQHDHIMNQSTPESRLVQREAEMIAKAAVAAIKESRKALVGESGGKRGVGVPTWTGKNGVLGRPGGLPSGGMGMALNKGPSSSSLLLGLQKKSGIIPSTPSSSSGNSTAAGQQQQEMKKFAVKIIDFMKLARDRNYLTGNEFPDLTSSEELVSFLNLKTRPEMAGLRRILGEVAIFMGVGKGWKLKNEYCN